MTPFASRLINDTATLPTAKIPTKTRLSRLSNPDFLRQLST